MGPVDPTDGSSGSRFPKLIFSFESCVATARLAAVEAAYVWRRLHECSCFTASLFKLDRWSTAKASEEEEEEEEELRRMRVTHCFSTFVLLFEPKSSTKMNQ
jgi:hypothetical protein